MMLATLGTHTHCNIVVVNNVRMEVDEERLRMSRESTANLKKSDKKFARVCHIL